MGIISLEEVEKFFDDFKALEKVNISVNKGEILGLIGPSGSGKSVLIKLLIGFFKPSSGKRVINPNIKVGFSMQNNSLYEYLTVKQNLNFFSKIYGVDKEERKRNVSLLIEGLKLKEFENILIKNLSGGTKKRVDIACSLVHNPDIILLDEPLNGLDPILSQMMLSFIVNLNKQGKTIIFSSHSYADLSSVCNRFFLVKNKTVKEINKSSIKSSYF